MSLFTPSLPAFFIISTYFAISWQELRKAIREVNSPPPQLEDPDRALDPGLKEDPDIFVELIDITFYQLSCDDAMMAIIADYPGLLPASHVRNPESQLLRRIPFYALTYRTHMVFYREGLRDATPNPQ